VRAHSKQVATKDLEKQIEYYGYKIEPFNMKEEQQMGEIDEDGFFVFSKKRHLKDAWLDSLHDNEGEQAIEQLRKRIKQEQGFQDVYQADPHRSQDYRSEDEQDEEAPLSDPQDPAQEQTDRLDPNDIKLLLAELLPFATNANQYLKSLKKQKEQELYEKVMYLCNEYIAATGEYDIMRLKKEDLEGDEEEEEEQAPIRHWDNDSEDPEQPQPAQQRQPQLKEEAEAAEEDDIF
jgi:hypothetical protein